MRTFWSRDCILILTALSFKVIFHPLWSLLLSHLGSTIQILHFMEKLWSPQIFLGRNNQDSSKMFLQIKSTLSSTQLAMKNKRQEQKVIYAEWGLLQTGKQYCLLYYTSVPGVLYMSIVEFLGNNYVCAPVCRWSSIFCVPTELSCSVSFPKHTADFRETLNSNPISYNFNLNIFFKKKSQK